MSKSVGIVRGVDDLGRIVVPKELRNALDIKRGDPMEVLVDNDGNITLRRYRPGCHFCGEIERNMIRHGNSRICQKCALEIGREARQ